MAVGGGISAGSGVAMASSCTDAARLIDMLLYLSTQKKTPQRRVGSRFIRLPLVGLARHDDQFLDFFLFVSPKPLTNIIVFDSKTAEKAYLFRSIPLYFNILFRFN